MTNTDSESESELLAEVQRFISKNEECPLYLLEKLETPRRAKRFVRKRSPDDHQRVLSAALENNKLKPFVNLLEYGANPDSMFFGFQSRMSGKEPSQSLLRKAINTTKTDFVRALLENGAGCDFIQVGWEKCDKGYWPRDSVITDSNVHRAVGQESRDIVHLLVEHGADILVRNKQKSQPLHTAIKTGNVGIVKSLLNSEKFGAEAANALDERVGECHKMPPLGVALSHFFHKKSDPSKYLQIIESLLTSGANPNVSLPSKTSHSSNSYVLLEFLKHSSQVYYGNGSDDIQFLRNVAKVADYFITHGADLARTNQNGDTVLHYFADFGFVELAPRCPLSLFDIANKDGWTSLHFAAANGQYKMIELLLDKAPNLRRRKTNANQTAADLSRENFPRCTQTLEGNETLRPPKSVRFASADGAVKAGFERQTSPLLNVPLSEIVARWKEMSEADLLARLRAILDTQTAEIKKLKEKVIEQDGQIKFYCENILKKEKPAYPTDNND